MTDAGFFKGTSCEQDSRFGDKRKKMLQSMKFAPGIDEKVDMSKIKLDVIKPWIAKRIIDLLGVDDDIVIEFVFSQLEERTPDGKDMQISLTGFLNGHNARSFVGELWTLLKSAQSRADGIPEILIQQKMEEIKKQQLEDAQAAAMKPNSPMTKDRKTSRSRSRSRPRHRSRSRSASRGNRFRSRSRSHDRSRRRSVSKSRSRSRDRREFSRRQSPNNFGKQRESGDNGFRPDDVKEKKAELPIVKPSNGEEKTSNGTSEIKRVVDKLPSRKAESKSPRSSTRSKSPPRKKERRRSRSRSASRQKNLKSSSTNDRLLRDENKRDRWSPSRRTMRADDYEIKRRRRRSRSNSRNRRTRRSRSDSRDRRRRRSKSPQEKRRQSGSDSRNRRRKSRSVSRDRHRRSRTSSRDRRDRRRRRDHSPSLDKGQSKKVEKPQPVRKRKSISRDSSPVRTNKEEDKKPPKVVEEVVAPVKVDEPKPKSKSSVLKKRKPSVSSSGSSSSSESSSTESSGSNSSSGSESDSDSESGSDSGSSSGTCSSASTGGSLTATERQLRERALKSLLTRKLEAKVSSSSLKSEDG